MRLRALPEHQCGSTTILDITRASLNGFPLFCEAVACWCGSSSPMNARRFVIFSTVTTVSRQSLLCHSYDSIRPCLGLSSSCVKFRAFQVSWDGLWNGTIAPPVLSALCTITLHLQLLCTCVRSRSYMFTQLRSAVPGLRHTNPTLAGTHRSLVIIRRRHSSAHTR